MAYGPNSLSVQGTVTTGEVDAAWIDHFCGDNEPYATISSSQTDPHTIQVTVDNAYPGYLGYCLADFKVGGTIPVYLDDIDFNQGNLTGCVVDPEDMSTGTFTATCDQLKVVWTDGLCTKFNPGGSEGSNMRVTVLDQAETNASYTFAIHYTFEQANASSCR